MEKGEFEQEPKLNIDNQKETPKRIAELSREELKKIEDEYEKWQNEYEKLNLEYDEKWDLMVAADDEEWVIMEKMHNEIDELYKTTEDPIKIKEGQKEIENKYEPLLNDAHMKERMTWQVWKEASKKLHEKWNEREAIENQLFKRETGQ